MPTTTQWVRHPATMIFGDNRTLEFIMQAMRGVWAPPARFHDLDPVDFAAAMFLSYMTPGAAHLAEEDRNRLVSAAFDMADRFFAECSKRHESVAAPRRIMSVALAQVGERLFDLNARLEAVDLHGSCEEVPMEFPAARWVTKDDAMSVLLILMPDLGYCYIARGTGEKFDTVIPNWAEQWSIRKLPAPQQAPEEA